MARATRKTTAEVRKVIARDEAIFAHQPTCPHCESKQVQIKFKATPTCWRCLECKYWFTSEPAKGN